MLKLKNSIINLVKNIKAWLIKDFDLKKTLISCGLAFLTFMLVFPAGALSSKTVDETCANYYADISKNHTTDVGDKKLSGLVVEPIDGKGTSVRTDTFKAINDLWGVFKGENASFAPVMNANRTHDIHFVDQDYSVESLPLVYSNEGDSTEPYHIDKKTKEVYDYKFQMSPLALMFSSSTSGMKDVLHIYISQAQAERKLKAKGVQEINYESLKTLLNTPIEMFIDGNVYKCVIDNIYLDNLSHEYHFRDYDYYYATDVGTVIGDFVYVILYANKENVFPANLKRQSLYIMSEYSFRNKTYLNYAKSSYSPDDFSFNYVRSNLKDGFVPDDAILQKTLKNSLENVFSIIITVFFCLSFATNIFVIFVYKLFKQPLSVSLTAIVSFLPYLLFKSVFAATNNILIFSSYSLSFVLILLAAFALTIIALNCFGRSIKVEEKHV